MVQSQELEKAEVVVEVQAVILGTLGVFLKEMVIKVVLMVVIH